MALSIEQKQKLVEEVSSEAKVALSAAAAEYRGLSVDQLTKLRSNAKDLNVYLKVVKNTLTKRAIKDTDFELKQLVSESLVTGGVSDIFKIAGLEIPDISILSEEFLAEVQKIPHKNLAVELLDKLINDEVKSFDTMLPTCPPVNILSLILLSSSSVNFSGVRLPGITSVLSNPSSVTRITFILGVHSDCIEP